MQTEFERVNYIIPKLAPRRGRNEDPVDPINLFYCKMYIILLHIHT